MVIVYTAKNDKKWYNYTKSTKRGSRVWRMDLEN